MGNLNCTVFDIASIVSSTKYLHLTERVNHTDKSRPEQKVTDRLQAIGSKLLLRPKQTNVEEKLSRYHL